MKKTDSLLQRFGPYTILLIALLFLAVPVDYRLPLTSPAVQDTAIPAPEPPQPPIFESFQGRPQLSLFPRLGAYQPEDGDAYLPFWKVYREHLLNISGVVQADAISGNRAFSFRAISGIDSVGHFAPLAVQPETTYHLRFKFKTDLSEGATAGVGINEYKEFIWRAEQYPKSLHNRLFVTSHELLRVTETAGWQDYAFTFTTSAQTRMVHLSFFREGPVAGREQVWVDDIAVVKE